MATDREIDEILRFGITCWAAELIGCLAPTPKIASELIIEAASLEPPCTTPNGQRSRS